MVKNENKTVQVYFHSTNGKADGKFYGEKNFPLVKFPSHKRPFLMMEFYCDNPECDCNEVFLEFIETADRGDSMKDQMRFSIHLSLRTWQENIKTERSKGAQCLVDKFINDLTDETKKRFKDNYKMNKAPAQNAAKFEMPIDEIYRGVMVRYADVFGDTLGASFEFEFEGKIYLIDDQYCINPECNCEQVILAFLEFCKEKETVSELFCGRLYFRKGLKIEDNPGCTREEGSKIFKEWQKRPGVIKILKKRYAEMKKVGQRLIAEAGEIVPEHFTAVDRKKKIGRNDPCPCGSGKKYKKCCGKPK